LPPLYFTKSSTLAPKELSRFPGLKSLTLHIAHNVPWDAIHKLEKLKHLKIYLKSYKTNVADLRVESFPHLETFHLKCRNFRNSESSLAAQHFRTVSKFYNLQSLTKLRELEITGFYHLTSSPELIDCLSKVPTLTQLDISDFASARYLNFKLCTSNLAAFNALVARLLAPKIANVLPNLSVLKVSTEFFGSTIQSLFGYNSWDLRPFDSIWKPVFSAIPPKKTIICCSNPESTTLLTAAIRMNSLDAIRHIISKCALTFLH